MAPLLALLPTKFATPVDNACETKLPPDSTGYNDICPHGFTPRCAQYAFHVDAVWLAMKAVNCAVVPEPSLRTTTRIGRFGSTMPGLSAWMRASFQLVIT